MPNPGWSLFRSLASTGRMRDGRNIQTGASIISGRSLVSNLHVVDGSFFIVGRPQPSHTIAALAERIASRGLRARRGRCVGAGQRCAERRLDFERIDERIALATSCRRCRRARPASRPVDHDRNWRRCDRPCRAPCRWWLLRVLPLEIARRDERDSERLSRTERSISSGSLRSRGPLVDGHTVAVGFERRDQLSGTSGAAMPIAHEVASRRRRHPQLLVERPQLTGTRIPVGGMSEEQQT